MICQWGAIMGKNPQCQNYVYYKIPLIFLDTLRFQSAITLRYDMQLPVCACFWALLLKKRVGYFEDALRILISKSDFLS